MLTDVLARSNLRSEREAQRAIEQRKLLEVTLGSIGDAVIATDVNRRVTFMNGVAETLTGWRHFEAENQPIERIFHIINEQTRAPAAGSNCESVCHTCDRWLWSITRC